MLKVKDEHGDVHLGCGYSPISRDQPTLRSQTIQETRNEHSALYVVHHTMQPYGGAKIVFGNSRER